MRVVHAVFRLDQGLGDFVLEYFSCKKEDADQAKVDLVAEVIAAGGREGDVVGPFPWSQEQLVEHLVENRLGVLYTTLKALAVRLGFEG